MAVGNHLYVKDRTAKGLFAVPPREASRVFLPLKGTFLPLTQANVFLAAKLFAYAIVPFYQKILFDFTVNEEKANRIFLESKCPIY